MLNQCTWPLCRFHCNIILQGNGAALSVTEVEPGGEAGYMWAITVSLSSCGQAVLEKCVNECADDFSEQLPKLHHDIERNLKEFVQKLNTQASSMDLKSDA
jgi:hypothetical protein